MPSYFLTRIHVEERLVPEFMPESEVEVTFIIIIDSYMPLSAMAL